MQQPPPTDPKTDLKYKCWICQYTVLNPCNSNDIGSCANWGKRCKADNKLMKMQDYYFNNPF